jgi:hypothetical protein
LNKFSEKNLRLNMVLGTAVSVNADCIITARVG